MPGTESRRTAAGFFSRDRSMKAASGGSGEKPAAKHDFVLSSGWGMGHHAAAHLYH